MKSATKSNDHSLSVLCVHRPRTAIIYIAYTYLYNRQNLKNKRFSYEKVIGRTIFCRKIVCDNNDILVSTQYYIVLYNIMDARWQDCVQLCNSIVHEFIKELIVSIINYYYYNNIVFKLSVSYYFRRVLATKGNYNNMWVEFRSMDLPTSLPSNWFVI